MCVCTVAARGKRNRDAYEYSRSHFRTNTGQSGRKKNTGKTGNLGGKVVRYNGPYAGDWTETRGNPETRPGMRGVHRSGRYVDPDSLAPDSFENMPEGTRAPLYRYMPTELPLTLPMTLKT